MRRAAAICAIALFGALAPVAQGELSQRGDLFVSFNGGIDPGALPRHTRAPIAVRVEGKVRTLAGHRPPSVRGIRIAINRGGRLDTRGLPVCPRAKIETRSSELALDACHAALVGTGDFAARTAFPEQHPFLLRGHILAFNARSNGHRAILAHVYSSQPVPVARVIVFHVSPGRGAYGTVLSASLPESLIDWGYLNRISLTLHRLFTYRGRVHSYISAACDAPPGFRSASFRFAHASMSFADGRTLSSTLTRGCRVRRPMLPRSATASVEAGAETTRSEYRQAVEPICARNAQANKNILSGVRGRVSKGELKPAGRQFVRASVALRRTLRELHQVPQPARDEETLSGWLAGVSREAGLLQATGKALIAGNRHGAERLVRKLTEGARETNATAAGFAFHHCQLETTAAG